MNIVDVLNKINDTIWSNPIIILLMVLSIAYTIAMKFGTFTTIKTQLKLLVGGNSSSDGLSAYEAFSTVLGYRVAVGNMAGISLALHHGGPGSLFWIVIAALATAGLAYAENSLGQIYKVRQDGQFRGGPYDYIERGMGSKTLGIIIALITVVAIPLFVSGAGANNIAMAFENSNGIDPMISGLILAILIFLAISGGLKSIAKVTTIIVPVMVLIYFLLTIVVMGSNLDKIIPTFKLIMDSAFNGKSFFGGLMGFAFSYGVKRSVNSSGAGMGETPPVAAAADADHPAEQGLVNVFSIFVNVFICLASGLTMVITDCYNVISPGGAYMYIGQGSAEMAVQASSQTAGVVWLQEAANTVIPNIGGFIIAVSLALFAFSTTIAYYYEVESGLAYLMRDSSEKSRKKAIWVLRLLMPIFNLLWANVAAATVWTVTEIALGMMIWVNGVAMIYLFPQVIKVYNDYIDQHRKGIKPFFNPEKLGIKNADIWMEINKDKII